MARVRRTSSSTPKRLAVVLMESVTSLFGLCAKHASRVSRKLCAVSTTSRVGPRRPVTQPKHLPPIHLGHRKRSNGGETVDGEYGGEGLWRRTILMGDKCQPLDFPGVIYYDNNGKQVSNPPLRSPRCSPLPGYLYLSAKQEE
ncbi:hypothetical protein NMG60_11005853 [Bertholletia excelsa]